MRRRTSPRTDPRGFTAIDALVAIAIALVAFSAIAGTAIAVGRAAAAIASSAREAIDGRNRAVDSLLVAPELP